MLLRRRQPGGAQALQADEPRLQSAPQAVHESESRVMTIDDVTVARLVLFECGMGDGAYPARIGRDEHADIVAALLDLELLSHSLGRVRRRRQRQTSAAPRVPQPTGRADRSEGTRRGY